MEPIGLVGLNPIGQHCVSKLVAAGYPLTVLDGDPALMEQAVAQGARAAASPAALADASHIILLAQPDVPDLVGQVRGHHVVIDVSNSSPPVFADLLRQVQERGARMVDAPIIWKKAGPTILVGGDAATFQDCRAVLEAIGAKVRHVGPAGAGHMVSFMNLIIRCGQGAAIAEGLVFGARAGVHLEVAAEALDLDERADVMLRREFEGAGTIGQVYANLGHLAVVAHDLRSPLPLTAFVTEVYKAVLRTADPRWYVPAVITYWEELAGSQARSGSEDTPARP